MTFQLISQMLKKNSHPIFKETPFARREKNIESDDSSDCEGAYEEVKEPLGPIKDARIAKINRILELTKEQLTSTSTEIDEQLKNSDDTRQSKRAAFLATKKKLDLEEKIE